MIDNDNDIGRRVASLETEMRDLRSEVRLGRVRYHDLNNALAPLVLENVEVKGALLELKDVRSALDHLKGVWSAITILSSVLAGVIAIGVSVYSHLGVVSH